MKRSNSKKSRRAFIRTTGIAGSFGLFAGCLDGLNDNSTGIEEFDFPQGTSKDGVQAQTVFNDHFETIKSEGSVTVSKVDDSKMVTSEGKERRIHSDQTTKLGASGILRNQEEEFGGAGSRNPVETSLWASRAGGEGLVRKSNPDKTIFEIRKRAPGVSDVIQEWALEKSGQSFKFTQAKKIKEIDGTPTVRYDIATVVNDETANRLVRGGGNVKEGSGSLFITEGGLLKRFSYEFTVDSKRGTTTQSGTITYSQIGDTTVEQPGWTSTARKQGRDFEIATTDDGYISFKMANGKPIPEGQNVMIHTPDAAMRKPFVLPQQMAVGDTLFAAFDQSTVTVELGEKPGRESNFNVESIFFTVFGSMMTTYRTNVGL